MIKPYSNEQSKKKQVTDMFDGIAGTYDFLNRFLSVGIDTSWRKKALKMLRPYPIQHLLDVATGTGDFAIMAAKILQPRKITGIDLSINMLQIARKKASSINFEFHPGDAESLNYETNTFDASTVAFGVRNFEDLDKGLREIHRVLKPGSPFMVLEFSRVAGFPLKQLFFVYSRYILPMIGKLFSLDPKAYRYLHESMHTFPAGKDFVTKLENAGFKFIRLQKFSFGICTAYLSEK
ncbi:MAG: bifunctional demethylmenaquinone methyltransferase/2-methoxy-6-polyprenyl-1,4-benzoquinol methylase UbiE [Saprospiraceae bacterium]|nr:bifunctional demethylmenaquinone methyltransferase/2-methoxy-6-polyprenyl-1,4-benzoquinol methylase UbiE [Saprospiraceae bacterium]